MFCHAGLRKCHVLSCGGRPPPGCAARAPAAGASLAAGFAARAGRGSLFCARFACAGVRGRGRVSRRARFARLTARARRRTPFSSCRTRPSPSCPRLVPGAGYGGKGNPCGNVMECHAMSWRRSVALPSRLALPDSHISFCLVSGYALPAGLRPARFPISSPPASEPGSQPWLPMPPQPAKNEIDRRSCGQNRGWAPARGPGRRLGGVRCEAAEDGCVHAVAPRAGEEASGGSRPASPPVRVGGRLQSCVPPSRQSKGRGRVSLLRFARVSRGRGCAGAGGRIAAARFVRVIARARRHTHLARPFPPGSFSRPPATLLRRKAERRPREPPLSTFILHHLGESQVHSGTKNENIGDFSWAADGMEARRSSSRQARDKSGHDGGVVQA